MRIWKAFDAELRSAVEFFRQGAQTGEPVPFSFSCSLCISLSNGLRSLSISLSLSLCLSLLSLQLSLSLAPHRLCLKCFPTVCYQTQKLIFARVPTQNQHPSLSLLPKPFDRPPVCGYPCKMSNPLCLCLRNPWTVPLSPCTHAKSISFSIFGCKIAVTSPRPLSPPPPPPHPFGSIAVRSVQRH